MIFELREIDAPASHQPGDKAKSPVVPVGHGAAHVRQWPSGFV